jgi:hypothetical protein
MKLSNLSTLLLGLLLFHFCSSTDATGGGLFRSLASDDVAPYVPRGSAKLETGNEHDFTEFAIVGDYVEAVSVVPSDTEWFGFHFFPGTIDPELFSQLLAGVPSETDNKAAIGYMFELNGTSVKGRAQWANYFGSIPDYLQSADSVFECKPEFAGEVCQYNEALGHGDFVVKIMGLLLISLQDQPIPDLEITEVTTNGVLTTIRWRRSLYPPFNFEDLRVRCARAPFLAAGETSLNDP